MKRTLVDPAHVPYVPPVRLTRRGRALCWLAVGVAVAALLYFALFWAVVPADAAPANEAARPELAHTGPRTAIAVVLGVAALVAGGLCLLAGLRSPKGRRS